MSEPLPLITFAQAEAIGQELHDRFEQMTGQAPALTREDMAWGDVVQFVLRRARDAADV